MRKGQIWISAVLYMALGVAILVIILAVGTPVLKKMRDKYTITQTKNVMFRLDNNIRSVYQQGPGAQIPITIDIGRGEFIINEDSDNLTWQFDSYIETSEPGVSIQEGNLIILTQTISTDQYKTIFTLDYNGTFNLTLNGTSSLSGKHNLLIRNQGGDPLLEINIIEFY